jgi:hypothetical protein
MSAHSYSPNTKLDVINLLMAIVICPEALSSLLDFQNCHTLTSEEAHHVKIGLGLSMQANTLLLRSFNLELGLVLSSTYWVFMFNPRGNQ